MGIGVEARLGGLSDAGDRLAPAPRWPGLASVAPGTAARGVSAAVRDTGVVALVTVLAFLLAGYVDIAEQYLDWAAAHERWQADEVPFTLLCLCGGVLWFAWRRAREARALRCRVQSLTRHLLVVQEEERRRLARELHDELGQHCAAIRFEARCLRQGLAAVDRALARQLEASADAIGNSAAALHADLRRLLTRLRPVALDTLGLESALEDLIANWQRTYSIVVERRIGDLGALPDGVAIAIFRVVQEALTNIARHAQARRVAVQAVVEHDVIAVDIRDDGRGFPPDGPPGGYGFGLTGMEERVAGFGGVLTLFGTAGGGVHVAVRIPVAGEVSGGGRP